MNEVMCPSCYGDGCIYCDYTGKIDSTLTVWGYLQDAPIKVHHYTKGVWRSKWGTFMERQGRRIIRLDFKGKLNDIFPEIEILSSDCISSKNRYREKGIMFGAYKKGLPDMIFLVHGKNRDNYEKHAVVFEIKYGASSINKDIIAFWRDLLTNPENYIRKCKSIKLFVIWFKGVDVHQRNFFYTEKEVKLEEIPNHFHNDEEDT